MLLLLMIPDFDACRAATVRPSRRSGLVQIKVLLESVSLQEPSSLLACFLGLGGGQLAFRRLGLVGEGCGLGCCCIVEHGWPSGHGWMSLPVQPKGAVGQLPFFRKPAMEDTFRVAPVEAVGLFPGAATVSASAPVNISRKKRPKVWVDSNGANWQLSVLRRDLGYVYEE